MPAVMRLYQEKHLREQAVPVIVGQITRKKTRKKEQAEQAESIQESNKYTKNLQAGKLFCLSTSKG
ncbi:MAG: hypothetical protein D3925_11970 [Candidatus Electrothrix sp. AR5]|nr:hypothetical protein [Candidatus Electrothrix sp. AR5]